MSGDKRRNVSKVVLDASALLALLNQEDGAERVAPLAPATRASGLSLGDRACLVLAKLLDATAITADHAWMGIESGTTIDLIR